MSLINQMLKDLEKRRADSVSAPDSPLKGVNRYTVARRRPPYLMYALLILLIVLAALVGYLGWAYLQTAQQENVAAVQSESATEVMPPVKPAPSTQTPSPQKSSPPVAREATLAKTPSAKEPVAAPDDPTEQAASTSVQQAKSKPEPANEPPADSQQVSKRHRPLSDTQRAELAYKEGYQLLARGRSEAGERKLRQALELYAGHQRARELLAGVYMKNGRYVEAAALLKDGVNLTPENSLFAKMYARVLLKQNKAVQAVRVLERQPPSPVVDSEYHALLAAVYQQAGEYLKSAGSYRDVLRVDPEQGKWWLGLGVSLEKLGKNEEARSAYLRARQSGSLSEGLNKYVQERLAVLEAGGL